MKRAFLILVIVGISALSALGRKAGTAASTDALAKERTPATAWLSTAQRTKT